MLNLRVLLTLIWIVPFLVRAAEFIQHPSSVNAFVNSNITFCCTARTTIDYAEGTTMIITMQWFVNGELQKMTNERTLDNKTLTSNLTIEGLEEYDGVYVRCLFIALASINGEIINDNVQSNKSYIHLQGVLSQATNLTIQYSQEVSMLFWTPPFSLEGLDINYYLTINSTNSTLDNITLTNSNNYTMPTAIFLPCNSYSFGVQPWNEVGITTATTVTSFFPGVPVVPDTVDVVSLTIDEVEITDIPLVNASLSFSVDTECFFQQNISFICYIPTQSFPVCNVADVREDVLILAVSGLPLNKVIDMSLTLANTVGNVTKSISINTYEVQRLRIVNNTKNGDTCLRCYFLTNSLIIGCHVILSLEGPSCYNKDISFAVNYNTSIFLPLNNYTGDVTFADSCISDVIDGVYLIEVYGINVNGSISNETMITSSEVKLKGATCSSQIVTSTTFTTAFDVPTVTNSVQPTITVTKDKGSANNVEIIVIVISLFTCLSIIISLVAISVFMYMKLYKKRRGVLTITDKTHSTPVNIEEIVNDTDTALPSSPRVLEPIHTVAASTVSPTLDFMHSARSTQLQTSNCNELENSDRKGKEAYTCIHNYLMQSNSTNSTGSETSVQQQNHFRHSGEYDHLDIVIANRQQESFETGSSLVELHV